MGDPRFFKALQLGAAPYKQIVKPGDQVLLLADDRTEPFLWEVFGAAARLVGGEPTLLVMQQRQRDYEDPPELVVEAARKADLIHMITTRALVHSRFGLEMSRSGKKKIISEGITSEMLLSGAAEADLATVSENNKKVNAMWDKGSHVHITSKLGTDLKMSIEGRKGFVGASNVPKSGFALGKAPAVQFPGGEAPIAPVEDTANGRLVVDKTLHHPTGLLKEPITLEIENGTITSITGGEEADEYRDWLESWSDEGGWRLCELSIGTNPKAYWMGNMRQDRFVLGSSHVGFGANDDVGGTIASNIHYDVIYSRPTIVVDDTVAVRDGEFLL